MSTPLLNGIRKTARGYGKDFIAGIDPTGTKTFEYGFKDAGTNNSNAKKRRAWGVAGGLLAGALLLPSASLGLIKGIGGFKYGLKGAGKGLVAGLKKPYADIFHGFHARRGMANAMKQQSVSDRQARSLLKMVEGASAESGVPMGNKNDAFSKIRELYARGKGINSRVASGSKEAISGLSYTDDIAAKGIGMAKSPQGKMLTNMSGMNLSDVEKAKANFSSALDTAKQVSNNSRKIQIATRKIDRIGGLNEIDRVKAILREVQQQSPEALKAGKDYSTRMLGMGLGMMGLGGAINASSAYAQYGAARKYGQRLTPAERARMLASRRQRR